MRPIKFLVSAIFIIEICCVRSSQSISKDRREIEAQFVQSILNTVEWNCVANENCTTPGTSCIDQKCQCQPHYVFNAAMTSCLKIATKYGDECEETSQCTAFMMAGGTCSEGICICSEGYHYVHGRCYKSAGLGEECNTDDHCYVNSDHGALSCKNQTCGCSDGYYQREYRTCRLAAKESGAECTIDLDCTYDDKARCNENSGCYVDNKNKTPRRLFRRSTFQNSNIFVVETAGSKAWSRKGCTTDKQCEVLGEAMCDSVTGMCVCKPGYFSDEATLSCVPELGEKCQEGDLSTIENSVCRFGLWGCKGATVSSKDNRICRKAVTVYTGYCQYDEQCYVFGPDASCAKNSCRCNSISHYSEKQKFCWINKKWGENCKNDEDCRNLDAKSVCNTESVCACSNGTHLDSTGIYCVNDVPSLGDRCSTQADCKGLNNSMCYYESCECETNFLESSGRCTSGINAVCEIDDDCEAVNSICKSSLCSCKDSYVKIHTGLCAPAVSFGDNCEYDAQCLANTTNSRCYSTGECVCQKDHRYRNGTCAKVKLYGDNCNYLVEECWDDVHPNSMSCSDHYCRCNKGFRPSSDWKYCSRDYSIASSSSGQKFQISIWLTIISMTLVARL